jgi:hypothetical protein
MNWFKFKKTNPVVIHPFIPSRQEADSREIEPHSSSALSTLVVNKLNIPKGVNSVLAQAITQNIRYTLSPNSNPSTVSGFRLTAGNDPIAIPIADGYTVLRVIAETDGAILEFQYGFMF